MIFSNRTDAGKKLAQELEQSLKRWYGANWKQNLIIVGLPRGGVPVALESARKFCCPLELIVSKKLPYPGQPEYAIGAVSSDGTVVLNPDIPDRPEWQDYIEQQRLKLLEQNSVLEREFYERAACPRTSVYNRTVAIIDDGIATGMTAIAALKTAYNRGAKRVIMAAPIMALDTSQKLQQYCDAVVSVTVEPEFHSVGQFYENFQQTTNEEVVAALREAAAFSIPAKSSSDLWLSN